MNKIKSLLSSPLFLGIASVVGLGISAALILPVSSYIIESSVSVTTNFYMVGAVMLLLALTSVFIAFLLVRIIWGNTRDDADLSDDASKEGDELASMRAMKVTGTKKAFVFGVILAAMIFGFDFFSNGILVTGSRRYHVMTQLRSPDGQDRADATHSAIQLVGDEEVAAALGKIMDHPGAAREWAAYAAGVRRDRSLTDSLVALLRKGTERERAAAAVALARLKDSRLIRLAIDAFPQMGELKVDLFIALGMMGKDEEVFSGQELKEVGEFLTGLLESRKLDKVQTRLAIWCLRMFESPEGLPYLEGLLSSQTDTQTLCMALEALGNIGSAESSPKMIEFIYKADKKANCTEMVAADFTGKEVLLCNNANLVVRIVHEIAHIGDSRAIVPMSRLAEDQKFPENIRNLASEFVFQKKYQRAGR